MFLDIRHAQAELPCQARSPVPTLRHAQPSPGPPLRHERADSG